MGIVSKPQAHCKMVIAGKAVQIYGLARSIAKWWWGCPLCRAPPSKSHIACLELLI
jgi:hypothetical protein